MVTFWTYAGESGTTLKAPRYNAYVIIPNEKKTLPYMVNQNMFQ